MDQDVLLMEKTSGIPVRPQRAIDEEIAKLSHEIHWYEEQAGQAVKRALQYKLEIGKRLKSARRLLPHGKFLRWAQNEFGWTPRHVQNHLKLAAHANRVSQLPPGASLRMALAAIKNSASVEQDISAFDTCAGKQRISILVEVEQGVLDGKRLVEQLKRITSELGAQESIWRTRVMGRRTSKI